MDFAEYKDKIAKEGRKTVWEEASKKAHDVQPKLNAMITFADYDDSYLEEADKNSYMYELPIVLKDNVNTKGIRTTAASHILENYVPIYDATVWEKLKAAGALLVGKASLDELAMGGTNKTAFTGPVHNPYDLDRISGGSSGGSAVLVASGVVPFAIGSDTGDSIRKPASYTGTVGVKPTYGRISRYGIIPYASSLDHVGFFTRSVEDAAKGLSVIAGRDDRDMTSSYEPVPDYFANLQSDLKGKKIAILKNVSDAVTNETINKQFADLITKMKEAGAIIDEVEMDEKLVRTMLPAYHIIANAEATANHSNLDGLRFGSQEDGATMEEMMMNSRTKGFGKLLRQRFVIGSYCLFVENQEKVFRKAQKVRRLIVDQYAGFMKDHDAIIALAAGGCAPYINTSADEDKLSDEYLIAENHLVINNFTGYPSMTMPLGYTDEKMPIGINISCKPFAEQEMFNIGLGIQNITGLKDLQKEVA